MNAKKCYNKHYILSSTTINCRSLPLKKGSLNRYFYIYTERKRKIPGNIED